MSRYRKVLTRIWEDERFKAFPGDIQRLFLYHLTSPRSTPFLLYVEGPGAFADALRMSAGKVRACMAELANQEMVWYSDEGADFVFLPKALLLAENAPTGPTSIKTYTALFCELPKTAFRDRCLQHWVNQGAGIPDTRTMAFLDSIRLDRPFAKGLAKPLGHASPKPFQEQEQEQEQEKDKGSVPVPSNGTRHAAPRSQEFKAEAQAILGWLNEKSGKHFRAVPVNLVPIEARLRDGIQPWQLRKIVTVKIREWAGDAKTKVWIRPETLFGKTKCEQYVGELPAEVAP